MRLDIGADGKIIGTRRVSPNGQVSGLTEYAGREVLVILPGRSDTGSSPSWPNVEEMTRLAGEQIRQAYDRYRVLQDTYATPWEATRSFMQGFFGGSTPDLMAEVDRWIRDQVRPRTSGDDPASTVPGRGSGNPDSRRAERPRGRKGRSPRRKRT